MQRHIIMLISGLLLHVMVLGQGVSVSADNALPDASAILDISSKTKGVLFPRMSESDRIAVANPAIGLMVWDTTHNGIWGYDGIQWREVSSKWERNMNHIYNRNSANVGIGISNPAYKLALDGKFAIYEHDEFIGSLYGNKDLVINAKLGTLIFESPPKNLIMQYDFEDILTTSGRVGIGVGEPKAKLHVATNMMIGEGDPAYGYALSVNGKIMATEMRIEAQNAWPDYVFDSQYSLPSLDELSGKIQALGHLPGIPSAVEIKSTGILVGDMQRIQMEKIEELTLYILQLHQRISTLEKCLYDLNHAVETDFQKH